MARGLPNRAVDDLLDGVSRLGGESPEVIRLTFKALHDVIHAQGEAIKALERGLEQRLTKADVLALLESRVSAADFTHALSRLSTTLDDKASHHDVASAIARDAPSHGQLEHEIETRLEPLVATLRALQTGAASVAEVQSVAEDTERRRAALEERLVLALEAKAGIREVAAELELRATVADVNALLDTKATVADVNESLQLKANKASVVAALAQKAGRADLDALVAEREPRAAREAELRDALARLDREARALARALEAGLAEAAATRDELATRVRELPTVLELRRALAAKADASQLRELSKLNSDLSGLSSERSEHAAALVDAREASAREARAVREELGALRRLLDGKADRLAVGHALEAKLDAAAARRWVDLLGDADATAELGGGGGGGFGGFGGGLGGGLGSGLGGGLGGGDGGRLGGSSALGGGIALGGGGLGGGVRAGGLIGRLLEAKADKRDVVDRRLLDELARRVDAQLHALAEAARADARAEAERVVATKADAAAVDALASALAGKADAQRTRAQLDALAQGGGGGGAGASASEQALILESLCSEHLLGRWIWKSGRTKPGGAGAVPWNAQNINTNPENFLWEPDRAHITCVAGGLYEITFGFYCRSKPAVQLLVNGEPVISAINSAAYAVHHSSGRLTSVGQHPAGNVTGLTLIDFLALPPRARVSLAFKGEEGAEGFLGLKKL